MLTNRQLFQQHLAFTTDFPLALEIERAEGLYMYGPEGQRYLDLIAGISVSNLGHRHPKVVQAIKDQLDKYMHLLVYGEFIQAPQVQLAHALTQTLPAPIDSVYFVSSGGEAIEGALKVAKRFTGRHELVSCINAYHGSTHGALSVGGNEGLKQAYRPLVPGIRHIHHGCMGNLDRITTQTAAVVIETVQGEAGVRASNTQYWQALRQRCTEVGALLILDEIQTGFGRTGTFWGFEHYGIVPDVVVTAKGMGGGMPLGAFMARQEVLGVIRNNPMLGHITTFGGHPVCAAASLATLKVLQEEDLIAQVAAKGQRFKEKLRHPAIHQVRGVGLLLAAQMESFEVMKRVIDRAIELGVVTDWFLFCDDAMRIAPPLTIGMEEIDWACGVILKAIEEVA